MIHDAEYPMQQKSPVPKSQRSPNSSLATETTKFPPYQKMNFYEALRELAENGKRVTKLEWANPSIYGVLKNGRVTLIKEDGTAHDWIINDGDLEGKDWVIV
jgi:hypothetical protein